MSGAGRRVRALVGLLAGLALAAAVVWWLAPDGRALVEYMSFQPGWIALAAALILAGNLTTSARWKLMTEAMGGTHLPLVVYAHGHALLRVVGQLSSTLLVDLLARGAVLRAAGSTRGHGHAITQAALERLGDILLPLIVLAWGVAFVDDPRAPTSIAALAVALAGFVALLTAALRPMTRLALALLATVRRSARAFEPPPPVAPAVALRVALLSVARLVTITAQFWACARALGLEVDPLQFLAVAPIALVAGILAITPGALGIQELGWAGALQWIDVDAAGVAVFVIAARVIVTCTFGLIALATWPLARRSGAAPMRERAPAASDGGPR